MHFASCLSNGHSVSFLFHPLSCSALHLSAALQLLCGRVVSAALQLLCGRVRRTSATLWTGALHLSYSVDGRERPTRTAVGQRATSGRPGRYPPSRHLVANGPGSRRWPPVPRLGLPDVMIGTRVMEKEIRNHKPPPINCATQAPGVSI